MIAIPDKAELRKEAHERRKALAAACPDFAARLAAHADALPLAAGSVVGAYHALPDEADPAQLLEALVTRGHHIAFPRVTAKDAPLEFHRVPDGEILRAGAYGIHEPAAHFPRATPGALLVPLLAFDASGHRLGYGGGFYDRTLFELKRGSALSVPAIGIAWAGQEVASLPHQPHDMALDFTLTEHGLKRFS
jgi:5-formyltetrahydrofolate cyclo-ligase